MTIPTSDALRQEARIMLTTAARILVEAEELQARVTALKRAARQVQEMADEQDDLARVQTLAGRPVRLAKKERVA